MNRFFYNAGTTGTGGTPDLPPSLSSIEPQMGFRMQPTPVIEPITPLVDPNKPADLIDPNKVKPNTEPEPIKTPAPEGKMYNDKGELVDDPNFKPTTEPNEPEIPEEQAFWETVEKLTGRPMKIDYPQGVDPISPEGVAHRESVVRQDQEAIYDKRIRESYPHAYAYMIHHMEGGSDEDFFNQNGSIALPERATVETSAELQTTLIKSDLLGKGVDPEIADAHVTKLIKDNKLKDAGLKVYDTIDKTQKDELANLDRLQRDNKAKADRAIADMDSNIKKSLKNINFAIPEADFNKVADFVTNNIQFDHKSGQFYMVQPLNPADLQAHLDMLTFQYYKGDLTKIINKKATTQATQRLRSNAARTKTTPSSSTEPLNNPTGYIPLGSIGKD